jgi:hypothetical protein
MILIANCRRYRVTSSRRTYPSASDPNGLANGADASRGHIPRQPLDRRPGTEFGRGSLAEAGYHISPVEVTEDTALGSQPFDELTLPRG